MNRNWIGIGNLEEIMFFNVCMTRIPSKCGPAMLSLLIFVFRIEAPDANVLELIMLSGGRTL